MRKQMVVVITMWVWLISRDDLKKSVSKGNLRRVKRLITKGVSIEDLDAALREAVWLGKADIVTYLLDHGAPVDGLPSNAFTHLILALCSKLSLSAALPLIAHGANPNARSAFGETALMLAGDTNNLEIVKALLEKGAEVNAVNKEGSTAMCYVKTPDIMKLLSQHGGRFF